MNSNKLKSLNEISIMMHKDNISLDEIKLYNSYFNNSTKINDRKRKIEEVYKDEKRIDIYNNTQYIYYINKKFKPCRDGWKCNRKICSFIHLYDDNICTYVLKYKTRCKNNRCDYIHLTPCKNEIINKKCELEYCTFLHKSFIKPKFTKKVKTINDDCMIGC